MKLKFNKSYAIYAISFFFIEIWIALLFKDGFIRHTLGDFLVVILLYCAIRSVINIRTNTAILLVLLIAFTIEGLQATNLLNYLNIQNNKAAQLILGTTFSIGDLIAYTFGCITIFFTENNSLNHEHSKNLHH